MSWIYYDLISSMLIPVLYSPLHSSPSVCSLCCWFRCQVWCIDGTLQEQGNPLWWGTRWRRYRTAHMRKWLRRKSSWDCSLNTKYQYISEDILKSRHVFDKPPLYRLMTSKRRRAHRSSSQPHQRVLQWYVRLRYGKKVRTHMQTCRSGAVSLVHYFLSGATSA